MKEHKSVDDFIKGTVLENLFITPSQRDNLQFLLDSGIKISSYDRRKTIKDFIEHNVDGDWSDRLNKLKKLSRQGNTLQHYQLKFGDETGLKKFNRCNDMACKSILDYVEKFGEIDGPLRFNKAQEKKKGNATIEKFIAIYGLEEGTTRWDVYQAKRRAAYKVRREDNYEFNNGRSLESYVNRHGRQTGLKLWVERNDKQAKRFSPSYYIDKYGEEEGKIKWQEYINSMDKTSLNVYKKKYGLEEGKRRYEIRIKNQSSHGNSKDYYIKKYGDDVGMKKYNEWLRNLAISINRSRYSKSSQKLFWWIYDELTEEQRTITRFGELNDELIVYTDNSFLLADFCCGKVIVEFYGKKFHGDDPEKDKERIRSMERLGFKVKIILESDFNKEKIMILNDTLRFIKDNWI